MVSLPDSPSDGAGRRGWQPDDGGFTLLRLDGHVRGRRLAYLMSSLFAQRAGIGTDVSGVGGQVDGSDSGAPDEALAVNKQSTARPLERRRYGIILVGPGARGQIPEADGWFVSVRATHLYNWRRVVLNLEHDRKGMRQRAAPLPQPRGSRTIGGGI
jgi:hypothetical protein